MKVVDSEDYSWILFKHSDKFLLDTNCNHSAFGYSFLIELGTHEEEAYRERGREYIQELAQAIHYSAPILRDSTSQYKGRDLTKELGEAATKAFLDWKSQQQGSAY